MCDEVNKAAHRVALEGLEGPVTAKATYMNAHVCAAGGKCGVVLPVDIQCWSCGIFSAYELVADLLSAVFKCGGKTVDITGVKRKLLLGFSCVCIPNDCRLKIVTTNYCIQKNTHFIGCSQEST